MDISLFKNTGTGRLVKTTDGHYAFVPNPLPPELKWSAGTGALLSQASYAFGHLAGIMKTLPDINLLAPAFLRREGVFSAQIKNPLISLSDIFLFESTGIAIHDNIKETVYYTKTIEQGFRRAEETPLNLELLRELHKILCTDAAADLRPGEFRDKQIWTESHSCPIDSATYVPPPPDEMNTAMTQLEDFLGSEKSLPAPVKAAFILYQLEAVRPFACGNGRTARIFTMLYLYQTQAFTVPLFGLSPFLAKYAAEYREAFHKTVHQGAWQAWVEFILRAVSTQAQDAVQRAHIMLALRRDMLKKIPGASPTMEKLVDLLFTTPVINMNAAAQALNLTFPAISKAMRRLETAGIIAEFTGNKRNKIYAAENILKLLEKD